MNEESFDYFNTDVNLLILHILLEGFFRGENTFTLDQFLKGDYWKIDEINEEVRDTNDSGSVEDMVLDQVFQITESLNLGKIKRLSIENISGLLDLAVRKAMNTENPTEDDIMYYTGVIGEIYELKKLGEEKLELEIKKQKNGNIGEILKRMSNRLNFDTAREALKYLTYISSFAAPHIELEISFIDEETREINNDIKDYLFSFSQDNFVEKKPVYKQKRYYFSKQLENFYNYIKELPTINGDINIPFSSLEEQGFEVIKVLSYLENEEKVKVRNWNDIDMWNVKFNITPITFQSLISKNNETKNEADFKKNLSFDKDKSLLTIDDKIIKILKGSDQYHLIRIIFENPDEVSKVWFFSEVAEKYEFANPPEDKKFYNATYQINQKIIRDTGIKDFFIATTQSVKINDKYLK